MTNSADVIQKTGDGVSRGRMNSEEITFEQGITLMNLQTLTHTREVNNN
jgi:hypothetical protein